MTISDEEAQSMVDEISLIASAINGLIADRWGYALVMVRKNDDETVALGGDGAGTLSILSNSPSSDVVRILLLSAVDQMNVNPQNVLVGGDSPERH